jgi:CBS domain-containing protein
LIDAFAVTHQGREDQLMKVSDILRAKGSNVVSVPATATVMTLVHRLKLERVGAAIVTGNGKTIDGIISERDVAWGLAEHGADLLNLRVADVMTKSVLTCTPDDTITSIARIMTDRRLRHLPVLSQGDLVGVVSIGDVVKHRIDEMQLEANVLRDYATARR